jgi:hypothetical protein
MTVVLQQFDAGHGWESVGPAEKHFGQLRQEMGKPMVKYFAESWSTSS